MGGDQHDASTSSSRVSPVQLQLQQQVLLLRAILHDTEAQLAATAATATKTKQVIPAPAFKALKMIRGAAATYQDGLSILYWCIQYAVARSISVSRRLLELRSSSDHRCSLQSPEVEVELRTFFCSHNVLGVEEEHDCCGSGGVEWTGLASQAPPGSLHQHDQQASTSISSQLSATPVYYGDGGGGFVIVGRSMDEVVGTILEVLEETQSNPAATPSEEEAERLTPTPRVPAVAPDEQALVGDCPLEVDSRKLREKDRLIELLTARIAELSGVGSGGEDKKAPLSLEGAKALLKAAASRLQEGDETAQADFDRWSKFVENHPDHIAELQAEETAWLNANRAAHLAALQLTRSWVPADIFHTDYCTLKQRGLSEPLSKRIWQKKALWLVRADPAFIARVHESDLNAKYSHQGLDVVECMALFACLPLRFENDVSGRKETFRSDLLKKLKEFGARETLPQSVRRAAAYPSCAGPFDPESQSQQHVVSPVTKSGAYMAVHRKEIEIRGEASAGRAQALPRASTLDVKKPGFLEELKRTANKSQNPPPEGKALRKLALVRPVKTPAATVTAGADFLAELKSKTSRRAKE